LPIDTIAQALDSLEAALGVGYDPLSVDGPAQALSARPPEFDHLPR
jgi:hypothetical protein